MMTLFHLLKLICGNGFKDTNFESVEPYGCKEWVVLYHYFKSSNIIGAAEYFTLADDQNKADFLRGSVANKCCGCLLEPLLRVDGEVYGFDVR
jgi:hypothetical protein